METKTEVYSQSGEQEHILRALEGITGRYLDIGAWNAKTFSNTRALYELGWSGVMIEPSPEPFLSLLRDYGEDERITLVLAAIGPANGLVKFYATADATSTTDTEHYRKWSKICRFYGSFRVPSITLSDITHQFGAFEFVNIDAEGLSAMVFHQLMNSGMLPKCICVEHDEKREDLKDAAGKKGYSCVFENGENLVFALGTV